MIMAESQEIEQQSEGIKDETYFAHKKLQNIKQQFARFPKYQIAPSAVKACLDQLNPPAAKSLNSRNIREPRKPKDLIITPLKGTELPTNLNFNFSNVKRRSYVPADVLKKCLDEYKKTYPEGAFRNPYSNTDGDDDISPLHLAAGSRNLQLLQSCLGSYYVDDVDKEGRTALLYAAMADDKESVLFLIKKGANIDLRDNGGMTACHWAAFYGKYDMLRLLIKKGTKWSIQDNDYRSALHWVVGSETSNTKCTELLLEHATEIDLNQPDKDLMAPIHWAVYHSSPKMTELLLKYKADVTRGDVDGKNPLHLAALNKDVECAQLLLDYCPRIASLPDLGGRTPLHLAIGENHAALVSLMTSYVECDLDAIDIQGRSPLHWAAVGGHHQLVSILLSKGASDKWKDSNGATALHYACSRNHAQCVQAFTSNRSFGYAADKEGRYPLTWAVTKGHVQAVKILLQSRVDTSLKDKQGNTALHAAAYAGTTHCMALLLENGCNVDAVDNQNHTPLFRCVERGFAEAANCLLQNRAQLEKTDAELRTPLHFSALYGHLPVLSLLLANGASIDRRDIGGRSALHFSAQVGSNETVKYLLECGADLHLEDNNGYSPIHKAAMFGHASTVELLLLSGSKVNATNSNFDLETPLDFALMGGHWECAKVLQQAGGLELKNLKNYSALIIQKVWRGYRTRVSFSPLRKQYAREKKAKDEAALIILKYYRSYLKRSGRYVSPEKQRISSSGDNNDDCSNVESKSNNEPNPKLDKVILPGQLEFDITLDPLEAEYFQMQFEKRKDENQERVGKTLSVPTDKRNSSTNSGKDLQNSDGKQPLEKSRSSNHSVKASANIPQKETKEVDCYYADDYEAGKSLATSNPPDEGELMNYYKQQLALIQQRKMELEREEELFQKRLFTLAKSKLDQSHS
jgi:ankyrin repeat protein